MDNRAKDSIQFIYLKIREVENLKNKKCENKEMTGGQKHLFNILIFNLWNMHKQSRRFKNEGGEPLILISVDFHWLSC